MAAASNSQVWHEWAQIERFLKSARLAFARERDLWTSLQLHDRQTAKLAAPVEQDVYRVKLGTHLATLANEQMLFASVLIHGYALAESAAMTCLSANARDFNGIEDWGPRLLGCRDKDWSHVLDGLGGAVEVAVVRNACAHGAPRIDQEGAKRLRRAGVRARAAGDPVELGYSELLQFRKRLRKLLKAGGI